MNKFRQLVVVVVALLFIGMSGGECLASNVQMSAADMACCQKMAGQCGSSEAAKHPCCKKVETHNEAAVEEAQPLSPVMWQVNLPASKIDSPSPLQTSTPSFSYSELLARPPSLSSSSTITILRI